MKTLTLRKPNIEDAAKMWQTVDTSPVLDTNSCYAYLLMCQHFPDTCAVCFDDAELQGFVIAYCPPHQLDTLFIWQIAVVESARGQGLGKQLLAEILDRDACKDVRYLEATVTPSNKPSTRLFESVARHFHAPVDKSVCFKKSVFASPSHEAEELFRIGPLEK